MTAPSLTSQIAAVQRMASLNVLCKLTKRASEQDLLREQLLAAAASLGDLERAQASYHTAPLHTRESSEGGQ